MFCLFQILGNSFDFFFLMYFFCFVVVIYLIFQEILGNVRNLFEITEKKMSPLRIVTFITSLVPKPLWWVSLHNLPYRWLRHCRELFLFRHRGIKQCCHFVKRAYHHVKVRRNAYPDYIELQKSRLQVALQRFILTSFIGSCLYNK